jgi:hypothetical protein
MYRGADKFLARPGRKQANISCRMAWTSLGADKFLARPGRKQANISCRRAWTSLGADKFLARPGRKQANVSRRMAWTSLGADKFLARPGRKQANISVRTACISFGALPCRGKKNLMTARVSMLLKSRASLTCFRACFLFLVGLRTYQHPGTVKIQNRYNSLVFSVLVRHNFVAFN